MVKNDYWSYTDHINEILSGSALFGNGSGVDAIHSKVVIPSVARNLISLIRLRFLCPLRGPRNDNVRRASMKLAFPNRLDRIGRQQANAGMGRPYNTRDWK